MNEDPSTVPVTVPDLRVGDVVKAANGHYYVIDSLPEPSNEQQEYPMPHIVMSVTEMNSDKTQTANGEKRVGYPQDAVLDVLTPRPDS